MKVLPQLLFAFVVSCLVFSHLAPGTAAGGSYNILPVIQVPYRVRRLFQVDIHIIFADRAYIRHDSAKPIALTAGFTNTFTFGTDQYVSRTSSGYGNNVQLEYQHEPQITCYAVVQTAPSLLGTILTVARTAQQVPPTVNASSPAVATHQPARPTKPLCC